MEKFLNAWNRTERFLVGMLTFFACMFTFYGVITRYGFSYSPEWIEETVMYMIIWAVFITASTLAEERGHVGATFIAELLPKKARRVLEIFTGLLAFLFCVLICFWGFQIVHLAYVTDERSLTSMRYPLWGTYLAVPIGAALIVGRYARRLYRLVFRFDVSDLRETHEMARTTQQQSDPMVKTEK